MLNVAMVGLGRWGQRLVDAVSTPGSAKLRFTHAVTRTPDKVRAYPVPVEDAIHGIEVMEAAIRSAASGGERVAVENFSV